MYCVDPAAIVPDAQFEVYPDGKVIDDTVIEALPVLVIVSVSTAVEPTDIEPNDMVPPDTLPPREMVEETPRPLAKIVLLP